MTVYLKTGRGYVEITQAHINRVAKRIRERRSRYKYWTGEEDLKLATKEGNGI